MRLSTDTFSGTTSTDSSTTRIQIYALDTLPIFKNRLAAKLDTLPEYLYFPDGLDTDLLFKQKGYTFEVEDMQEVITSYSSLDEFLKYIKRDAIKDKILIKNYITPLWVLKHGGQEASTSTKHVEKLTERELSRKIIQNKDWMESTLKHMRSFENIGEEKGFTPFELDSISFELQVDVNNTLLGLFDRINLNDEVPFASIKDFYKILKNFTPERNWVKSNKNWVRVAPEPVSRTRLILKVFQITEYSDVVFRQEEETGVERPVEQVPKTTVEIQIKAGKEITRDEFIQRAFSVFPFEIKVNRIVENKIIGTFFYPNMSFNKYIFSDFILNDPLFSINPIITINESEKASRDRIGVYIHFNSVKTGDIRANVSSKKMIKNDPSAKGQGFKEGMLYIRVYVVKAENIKAIEQFQILLEKVFKLYRSKYNGIVAEYRKYMSKDFKAEEFEEKGEVRKRIKPEETNPDLFITNYTRACVNRPTIISEEEYDEGIKKGKNVVKFPRDALANDPNPIPSDGKKQFYYTCKDPTHPYLGLQRNSLLTNSDRYPYIPCCFKNNQVKKPIYQSYFNRVKVDDVHVEHQSGIIKTNKILDHDAFGYIPKDLDTLFSVLYLDPNYAFVRKGVHRSQNSFLEVVSEAMGKFRSQAELTEIRKELTERTSTCKQEMYDVSKIEIQQWLNATNKYFDPKLFIHMLELYFDCNIYLFSKTDSNDGEMIVPRYSQAYYRNIREVPCVYVYEHMGSEFDKAEYPQCELIMRYELSDTKNVEYQFAYDFSRPIREVYNQIKQAYAYNKEIKENDLSFLNNRSMGTQVKVESQWFDSYGKTRGINVTFNNEKISLVMDPVQPIDTVETTPQVFPTTLDTAKKLVQLLGFSIRSRDEKELVCTRDGFNLTIQLEESPLSALDEYNKNKRMARYVVEYMFWIYSTQLYQRYGAEYNSALIERKENPDVPDLFIIDPEYIYPPLIMNSSFDLLRCPFIKNGKIIVHTEEIVKRLQYVLRLNLQSREKEILSYYRRTQISQFYEDVSDFDSSDRQIILKGADSVEKLLDKKTVKYTLTNEILINEETPYFFKNSILGESIYLARNTDTLENAEKIILDWYQGSSTTQLKEVSVYQYNNADDIKKVNKDITSYKILEYMPTKTRNAFTVLIKNEKQ